MARPRGAPKTKPHKTPFKIRHKLAHRCSQRYEPLKPRWPLWIVTDWMNACQTCEGDGKMISDHHPEADAPHHKPNTKAVEIVIPSNRDPVRRRSVPEWRRSAQATRRPSVDSLIGPCLVLMVVSDVVMMKVCIGNSRSSWSCLSVQVRGSQPRFLKNLKI